MESSLNGPPFKLTFGCCFCGDDIESPNHEVQVVVVFESPHVSEHLEQTWWAHLVCFENTLHPAYREFREEWYEMKEGEDAGL